ncbi:DUF1330 domain-containing protein [Pseudomonas sp. BN607]|nr:DUF1330 domain-containing protein [Pseudomonas sp. BN607]
MPELRSQPGRSRMISSSMTSMNTKFASLEQAKACSNDPAYVQAKAFATQASRRELIILEGEL